MNRIVLLINQFVIFLHIVLLVKKGDYIGNNGGDLGRLWGDMTDFGEIF